MKKAAYILILALGFWQFSCQKQGINYQKIRLPKQVTINLPESISSDRLKDVINEDSINGQKIYAYMQYFIFTAENAAKYIENILNKLSYLELKAGETFSFTGEDGRIKILEVSEFQNYNKITWRYKITIRDQQIQVDSQNGLAFELFWNTEPKECIAIIKPAYFDTKNFNKWQDTKIRLYYSENPTKNSGYEEIMIVEIADKPLKTPKFGMKNMKMFVGRYGNQINLYGNADLPKAWLLIPRARPGIDWAFVASANYQNKLAVAEVGLPPNYINTNSRNAIFRNYSIFNVLKVEYYHWYLQRHGQPPDTSVLNNFLKDTKAPGYFNKNGFVQGGERPNENYASLEEAIKSLKPYKPKEIAELQILF